MRKFPPSTGVVLVVDQASHHYRFGIVVDDDTAFELRYGRKPEQPPGSIGVLGDMAVISDIAYQAESLGFAHLRAASRYRPTPDYHLAADTHLFRIPIELVNYAWSRGSDPRSFSDERRRELAGWLTQGMAEKRQQDEARRARRSLEGFLAEVTSIAKSSSVGGAEAALMSGCGGATEGFRGINRIGDRHVLVRCDNDVSATLIMAELARVKMPVEMMDDGRTVEVKDRGEVLA